MKYHSVIFDLDGVLCYTDKYHYAAWKQIADEEGIYFDETINARLRGVSRMDSLDIILERANKAYTQKQKNRLAERKNAIYVDLLRNMGRDCLCEDCEETLNKLKNKDVKIAVGSSSKNARLILEKTGLDSFFDAVADGTLITHSKPHPEVFLKAADMLCASPCECLVVEDACAGIEAASRGGFDSAAIGDARHSDEATYKIDKLYDLTDIVK